MKCPANFSFKIAVVPTLLRVDDLEDRRGVPTICAANDLDLPPLSVAIHMQRSQHGAAVTGFPVMG